ncbi:tyrosine-protein phosphatase [Leucobacter luti]|uniref:tyrosine-protein phosphatase n=1 Tax=Leucobacter luti TaxID=340320 RepID=UPI003CFC08A9
MLELVIDGSYNARGIGPAGNTWLARSASLDGITPAGIAALEKLGIALVLDLREPGERGPVRHGIPTRNLPLYGERPPQTGSLEEVYRLLLTERAAAITAAVSAIAECDGPVLVHCTAGKDRTGLVVALARLAAGYARSDVVADYALSGRSVRPARTGIVAPLLETLARKAGAAGSQAPGGGISARSDAERLHLDSPAEALEYALDLVDEHGGPAEYLLAHGATESQLAALAERAGTTLGAGSR